MKLSLFTFLCFALWLPGAIGAQESDVTSEAYALERLQVSDGYPVGGVEEGKILEQSFDIGCNVRSDKVRADSKPLAGKVSETVTLEVSTMVCPERTELPGVACQWEIEGTGLAGDIHAEEGQTARGDIPLPEQTGTYTLAVQCRDPKDDPIPPVRRLVFVTYDEPSLSDSEVPSVDAYKRACDWGGGFGSDADPSKILEQMLGGLFNYGRKFWRYGSFDTEEHDEGTGNYRPVCVSDFWCRCPWQAMVTEKTACNFGSCYQFSDVFENVAAVLGITGMESVVIKGDEGLGFVTDPNTVSLDLRFPSNITCQGDDCPRYLFSSHSLREFDGRYYDATFNKIYADRNEPIFQNVTHKDVFRFYLQESDLILCTTAHSYGNWRRYSAPCASLLLRDGPAAATFETTPSFKIDKEEEDLVATFKVRILEAGKYALNAVLFKDGDPLVFSRGAEDPSFTGGFFYGKATGSSEPQEVEVSFSGEALLPELGTLPMPGTKLPKGEDMPRYRLQAALIGSRGLESELMVYGESIEVGVELFLKLLEKSAGMLKKKRLPFPKE